MDTSSSVDTLDSDMCDREFAINLTAFAFLPKAAMGWALLSFFQGLYTVLAFHKSKSDYIVLQRR
ncbi:hypothetical protein BDW72DRAFT_173983 [Aspergillus terricola var. indicus]